MCVHAAEKSATREHTNNVSAYVCVCVCEMGYIHVLLVSHCACTCVHWITDCMFFLLMITMETARCQCINGLDHYPLDTLAKVLLTNTVPSSNICSKQPVQVCRNASFVVDLHKLDDPLVVRADENGVWKRKGSPVAYVSMHTDEGKTRFFRRTKAPTRSNQYKITRTYYRHASSPDFTRIITAVHGKSLLIFIT